MKKKEVKTNVNNEHVQPNDILKSKNDPTGLYTGQTKYGEKPEVDADDL